MSSKIKVSNIEQIGYAVPDAKAAARLFEELFDLEPFEDGPEDGVALDGLYCGKPMHTVTKGSMGKWGDLEIELLQAVEGDSPWGDAVKNGHEGINRIRFQVEDTKAAIERFEELGCEVQWKLEYEPMNRTMIYAFHEPTGLMFEASGPMD